MLANYNNLKEAHILKQKEELQKEGLYLKNIPSEEKEFSENGLRFCTLFEEDLKKFYIKCLHYLGKNEILEATNIIKTDTKADRFLEMCGIGFDFASVHCGFKEPSQNLDFKYAAEAFLSHCKKPDDIQIIIEQITFHLAHRLENLINALKLNENGVDKLVSFLSQNIKAQILANKLFFEKKEEFVGYICKHAIPTDSQLYQESFMRLIIKIEFIEKRDCGSQSCFRKLKGALLDAHAVQLNGNIYIKENTNNPFSYPPHKLNNREEAIYLGFKPFFIFDKKILFPEKSQHKYGFLVHLFSERQDLFSLPKEKIQGIYKFYQDFQTILYKLKRRQKEEDLLELLETCVKTLDYLILIFLYFFYSKSKFHSWLLEGDTIIIFLMTHLCSLKDLIDKGFEESKKYSTMFQSKRQQSYITRYNHKHDSLQVYFETYSTGFINLQRFEELDKISPEQPKKEEAYCFIL